MTFTIIHSATVTLNKNMDYSMNLIYSHLIIYCPTASFNVHFMSDFCYLQPSFCSLSKLLLIQNVRTEAHLIKKVEHTLQNVFSMVLFLMYLSLLYLNNCSYCEFTPIKTAMSLYQNATYCK